MATAEELWAAAARSALAGDEEEEEEEVALEIPEGEEMAVEDQETEVEGITPEEEAEAMLLVQQELEAEEDTGATVELDDDGMEEEPLEDLDAVELEAVPEPPAAQPRQPQPEAAASLPPPPPPPQSGTPRQPAPEASSSKAAGKEGGKGWKGGKGKGKGKGGKGKDESLYYGLVHQVGEKTGNMLVKCWKVTDLFGQEAMIPKLANPSNAALGDKISFEVMERPDGARPLAVNVVVRGHIDLEAQAAGEASEIRRQVLYYLSDDNLRTDKFFQDIIAANEGGWISMTTILGCPRMKQMNATSEAVFSALRDATEVELREAPGEEAVRRTSPPPPLEEPGGKGKGKGKGGGNAAALAALAKTAPQTKARPLSKTAPAAKAPVAKAQVAKAPAAVSKAPAAAAAPAAEEEAPMAADEAEAPAEEAELYYVGLVKSQMRMEPRKLFLSCEEVTKAFGRDAYFLPDQQPQGVEVGSLVVFTLPPDCEAAFAPQARFVGRLAPLGSLGRGEGLQGSPSKGDVAKAPGVQKTIVKR